MQMMILYDVLVIWQQYNFLITTDVMILDSQFRGCLHGGEQTILVGIYPASHLNSL